MDTTRERPIAGAPNRPIAGAPKPAGANGPVITAHCRRAWMFAGGKAATAGAPALIRRQLPYSTGALVAAPAVGMPALARALCAGSR
jgi:hypothetical protein